MKLLSIFYLALFPFLHNTTYSAKINTCGSDGITLTAQGSTMNVTLFNLKITKEEGWGRVCNLLKGAQNVTFELDTSVKIEDPLPVYLFADGKLVQEEVIRNNEGYSVIRNPEYKYEKRIMELQDTTQVMANLSNRPLTRDHLSYGWLFLLMFMIMWGFLFYHLIYKHSKYRRKSVLKKRRQI